MMERWYLLGLFELSKIFQELGNMVFRAVLQVTSRDIGYLQTDGIAVDPPLGPYWMKYRWFSLKGLYLSYL